MSCTDRLSIAGLRELDRVKYGIEAFKGCGQDPKRLAKVMTALFSPTQASSIHRAHVDNVETPKDTLKEGRTK